MTPLQWCLFEYLCSNIIISYICSEQVLGRSQISITNFFAKSGNDWHRLLNTPLILTYYRHEEWRNALSLKKEKKEKKRKENKGLRESPLRISKNWANLHTTGKTILVSDNGSVSWRKSSDIPDMTLTKIYNYFLFPTYKCSRIYGDQSPRSFDKNEYCFP